MAGQISTNICGLIPLRCKCSKVCLPIENCSPSRGPGSPNPLLSLTLQLQFVQSLKAEFTFGLLLDFRKHRTILSFINNAEWVLCLLSSPLSSLQPPESYEATMATNKRRAMNASNQQRELFRMLLSALLLAIFWCMERGFLSSRRAKQSSSLHFPPSFRVQSPASKWDGQITAGRVPPPPSGPMRGSLGGQQPIRGETWRKGGRCSGRTPGGLGPRMLRAPRSCARLAGVCPDYTRVPAWLSVWIEN